MAECRLPKLVGKRQERLEGNMKSRSILNVGIILENLGGSVVKHRPSARVNILGSWDRFPSQAPAQQGACFPRSLPRDPHPTTPPMLAPNLSLSQK